MIFIDNFFMHTGGGQTLQSSFCIYAFSDLYISVDLGGGPPAKDLCEDNMHKSKMIH